MAIRRPQVRSAGRTFIAILLVAIAIVLAVAVWQLSDAVSRNKDDPGQQVYFFRMMQLAAAVLLVTLALLGMRGIRWIVGRCAPRPDVEPTSQVSAWEEAGKRFKLPEDDDEYSPDA